MSDSNTNLLFNSGATNHSHASDDGDDDGDGDGDGRNLKVMKSDCYRRAQVPKNYTILN